MVEEDYPQAQRITLVLDNLSTHTGASLYKTFEPEKARALLDKLEFVYTPKHGSWLNLAECEFSVLARQCLDRRIADIDTLRHEVSAWTEQRNRTSKPVEWRFTTADARIKLSYAIFIQRLEIDEQIGGGRREPRFAVSPPQPAGWRFAPSSADRRR